MKMGKLLMVVVAVSLSTMALVRERGVRLVTPSQPSEPLPPFDPSQSAALFVGVSDFQHDLTVPPVRYTVDDAIDLAYTFAVERNVKLVHADRIVLALSGDPVKRTSQARLQTLQTLGAFVAEASQEKVAALLRRQSQLAGSAGMLIAFFASHGFSSEGTPYVLASTSVLGQRETSLSAAHVLDVVAESPARRSLVLIDACRERFPGKRGKEATNPANAAPLLAEMKQIAGQVVFYAAGPGSFSYEDPRLGNGVFTRAVIDGLSCEAARTRGLVTVETLAEFVEMRVRNWVRANRDRDIVRATQVSMDPVTMAMPLTTCARTPSPARVKAGGRTVIAFAQDDEELWRNDVQGEVTHFDIADLDNDDTKEVLVGVGGTGEDSGKIIAFNAIGKRLWSADTGLPVRRFLIDHLYNVRQRETIAISIGYDSRSRLTIIAPDGTKLAAYAHEGELLDVLVDRVRSQFEPKVIVIAKETDAGAQLDFTGSAVGLHLVDRPTRGHAAPTLATLDDGSEWRGAVLPPTDKLTRFETIDYDNDRNRDIALHTSSRDAVYLDFQGRVVGRTGRAGFQLLK